MIAWELFDATANPAAVLQPGPGAHPVVRRQLGPVETLSAPGASSVEVASDASGDAVVVWTRSNGGAARIQAVAGP